MSIHMTSVTLVLTHLWWNSWTVLRYSSDCLGEGKGSTEQPCSMSHACGRYPLTLELNPEPLDQTWIWLSFLDLRWCIMNAVKYCTMFLLWIAPQIPFVCNLEGLAHSIPQHTLNDLTHYFRALLDSYCGTKLTFNLGVSKGRAGSLCNSLNGFDPCSNVWVSKVRKMSLNAYENTELWQHPDLLVGSGLDLKGEHFCLQDANRGEVRNLVEAELGWLRRDPLFLKAFEIDVSSVDCNIVLPCICFEFGGYNLMRRFKQTTMLLIVEHTASCSWHGWSGWNLDRDDRKSPLVMLVGQFLDAQVCSCRFGDHAAWHLVCYVQRNVSWILLRIQPMCRNELNIEGVRPLFWSGTWTPRPMKLLSASWRNILPCSMRPVCHSSGSEHSEIIWQNILWLQYGWSAWDVRSLLLRSSMFQFDPKLFPGLGKIWPGWPGATGMDIGICSHVKPAKVI